MRHMYSHPGEYRKIFLANYLCIGFVPGGMLIRPDLPKEMPHVTGPGCQTMENGLRRTSLARPSVTLLCTLFNRGGNRRRLRPPGEGGDHVHCTVEPPRGHTRCRSPKKSKIPTPGAQQKQRQTQKSQTIVMLFLLLCQCAPRSVDFTSIF